MHIQLQTSNLPNISNLVRCLLKEMSSSDRCGSCAAIWTTSSGETWELWTRLRARSSAGRSIGSGQRQFGRLRKRGRELWGRGTTSWQAKVEGRHASGQCSVCKLIALHATKTSAGRRMVKQDSPSKACRLAPSTRMQLWLLHSYACHKRTHTHAHTHYMHTITHALRTTTRTCALLTYKLTRACTAHDRHAHHAHTHTCTHL